jgi:hypothetical protein
MENHYSSNFVHQPLVTFNISLFVNLDKKHLLYRIQHDLTRLCCCISRLVVVNFILISFDLRSCNCRMSLLTFTQDVISILFSYMFPQDEVVTICNLHIGP